MIAQENGGPQEPSQEDRALMEEAIRWSVADLLILRSEMSHHDIGEDLQASIIAASAPAFIVMEVMMRADEG